MSKYPTIEWSCGAQAGILHQCVCHGCMKKNLLRELWAIGMQSACHVINRLPPWPGKASSLFEANQMLVIFEFLGLFVMFIYPKITELNLTQELGIAFLLVIILAGKDGDVWI